MKNKKWLFFLVPPIILVAVTFIVMWLWNILLPAILGVKMITFWQAMGILILSKILFGGFHGGGRKFRWMKEKHFSHKMQNMSPEEREKFREMWRKRCGTDFGNQENT